MGHRPIAKFGNLLCCPEVEGLNNATVDREFIVGNLNDDLIPAWLQSKIAYIRSVQRLISFFLCGYPA
ncbi:hypothetical protein D3C80_2054930 [compost metagenome]